MHKASTSLRPGRGPLPCGVAVLLAATAATAQVAAPRSGGTGQAAAGSYQAELQACQQRADPQDRATCLREARNARAEALRGKLEPGSDFEANAKARCTAFKDQEERAACEARVMGYGTVSGSVEAGGILREVETVVLPPGQDDVTLQPRTPSPVLLVPENGQVKPVPRRAR